MSGPITAVAIGGKVRIEVDAPAVDLTPEEADRFWNAIAEAELVALEQRVRARRRVTEGARGGWVNAPAQGRHAVDAGMALAESTAAALNRLAPPSPAARLLAAEAAIRAAQPEPGHQLLAEYGTDDYYRRRAAPEPDDPYPAPDYQHPEPGDDDDEASQ